PALRRGRARGHRNPARVDLGRAAQAQDRLQPRRAPGRGDGSRGRGHAAGAQWRPQRAGAAAAAVALRFVEAAVAAIAAMAAPTTGTRVIPHSACASDTFATYSPGWSHL